MSHSCWASLMEELGWEEFLFQLDREDNPDGIDSTCLLPDGHEGPHEFVRDDKICVEFK